MIEEEAREVEKYALEVCNSVICLCQAVNQFGRESEIADYIKMKLDEERRPMWNCIVGRCFGGFVTHETKHYYYFSIGHLNFLVWKSC